VVVAVARAVLAKDPELPAAVREAVRTVPRRAGRRPAGVAAPIGLLNPRVLDGRLLADRIPDHPVEGPRSNVHRGIEIRPLPPLGERRVVEIRGAEDDS